jgi:hypothetical protein
VAAIAVAFSAGAFAVPSSQPLPAVILGMALAVAAGAHFHWTRRIPPRSGTWYARWSTDDRPGALTLVAATGAIFGAARVAIEPWLQGSAGAFDAAESVILAVLAILLLLLARRCVDRAMLGVAALVTVAAGIKVFGVDLLSLHGVPLVASVFSFGVVAAVGSAVLGRWPRN